MSCSFSCISETSIRILVFFSGAEQFRQQEEDLYSWGNKIKKNGMRGGGGGGNGAAMVKMKNM